MFDFLKKGKFEALSVRIERAFSKVEGDIKDIQAWMSHLHNKSDNLESSHHESIALTRKDLQHLNSWIRYLYAHVGNLHESVKRLANGMDQIARRNEEIHKRLLEIEAKSHFSHVEPKTQSPEPVSKPESRRVIGVEQVKMNDVDELSQSEKSVLAAIYSSGKSVGYDELSSRLKLNYTTVKNLIYKIRKKGFNIRSRMNEFGEKEFFIDRELRLRVSGR